MPNLVPQRPFCYLNFISVAKMSISCHYLMFQLMCTLKNLYENGIIFYYYYYFFFIEIDTISWDATLTELFFSPFLSLGANSFLLK